MVPYHLSTSEHNLSPENTDTQYLSSLCCDLLNLKCLVLIRDDRGNIVQAAARHTQACDT